MGQKGKRERVEQNGEERGEMREEREKGESRAKGERERVGWVRVSGAREKERVGRERVRGNWDKRVNEKES